MTPTTMPPDLYCVMGNPVEHSRSPTIHARFADLTSQSIVYERRLIGIDDFAQGIQQFAAQGGRGCNITVPFKGQAAQLATQRSPRVALAGAANTLIWQADGIYADNTDGLGLLADITLNAGFTVAGKDVLLVGAGGAAAGVLGSLLEAHPRHITVTNRTFSRAQALVSAHNALAHQHQVDLRSQTQNNIDQDFDIIINASASSLSGADIPIPARVLRSGCLAYDMMYGPAAEHFLNWAARHGAQPRDGLGMLVEQAAEAFALWRGIRPPSSQVLKELRDQDTQTKAAITLPISPSAAIHASVMPAAGPRT